MNRNITLQAATLSVLVVSCLPLRLVAQVASVAPANMPRIGAVDERFESYNIEMVHGGRGQGGGSAGLRRVPLSYVLVQKTRPPRFPQSWPLTKPTARAPQAAPDKPFDPVLETKAHILGHIPR